MFILDTKDVEVSPRPLPTALIPIDARATDGETISLKGLVLNTNPQAVSEFQMFDKGFFFKCRMNGVVHTVTIPYEAVIKLECPDSNLSQGFDYVFESISKETDKKVVKKPENKFTGLVRIK